MRKSKNIATYSDEELKKARREGKSKTDWDRIKSMPAKERKKAREEDPDVAPTPRPDEWDDLIVSVTPPKEPLYMRVDAEVLAWYRSQGRGFQGTINAVLRSYMQAQQRKFSAADSYP